MLNARFFQKEILIIRIIYQVLRLAIITWGTQTGQDFLFFVIGFAVIDVLESLIGLTIISFKIARPRLSYILKPFTETKVETEYRLLSYINKIGTSFLNTDIDRFILAYFSTPTQVAIYVLSTQVMRKLGHFLPDRMFKPLATPAFFSEYDNSQENKQKLNSMFQLLFNANNIADFSSSQFFGHKEQNC